MEIVLHVSSIFSFTFSGTEKVMYLFRQKLSGILGSGLVASIRHLLVCILIQK